MYKVTCGSTVDHLICFGCEKQWREKMPIREGERKLTCPTCRQRETSRTVDSLERELNALYVSRPTLTLEEEILNAFQLFQRVDPRLRAVFARNLLATTLPAPAARPSRPRPPVPQVCASGRDCFTRSRVNARSKTILKCRTCREVACCKTCMFCVGCMPLEPRSASRSAPSSATA
jgi:hypothetical protein